MKFYLSGMAQETSFEELSGIGGYIASMRMFSRNARLYLLHISICSFAGSARPRVSLWPLDQGADASSLVMQEEDVAVPVAG